MAAVIMLEHYMAIRQNKCIYRAHFIAACYLKRQQQQQKKDKTKNQRMKLKISNAMILIHTHTHKHTYTVYIQTGLRLSSSSIHWKITGIRNM